MNPPRRVLLISHTGRPQALDTARSVSARLLRAGVALRLLDSEAEALAVPGAEVLGEGPELMDGVDLVLVLGGDGTLLRGAELARTGDAVLLGVNLGHVGFLAEAELDGLDASVDRLVRGDFEVEDRLTLDLRVCHPDGRTTAGWALNDVSVEKPNRSRMLECVIEVEGHPLSSWGCDGVVLATPTGSTAYAFSGGGPVVWPTVQALLLVPISAHALFARPLVVSPDTHLAVELRTEAFITCDGRRTFDLAAGGRVEVTGGSQPVRLARLSPSPFTDRLVRKFELPVHGWRGH